MSSTLTTADRPEARPTPTTRRSHRRSGRSRDRRRFAGLFLEAPPPTSSVWSIAASVGAISTGVLLSLARQGGPGAMDSVWAEDGPVLLQSTYHHGIVSSLVLPNNGYLSVPQRLLIWLVRLFPLSWAAALLAVMGAVISCSCALLIYRASAAHIRSPMIRACIIALPIALLYVGNNEVDNCLINTQWYLFYTAFWMSVWRPASRPARIVAAIIVFSTVASCPVGLLTCAPLLLMRLRYVPWRENRLLLGALAAGVCLQGTASLAGAGNTRVLTPNYNLLTALLGYLNQVVAVLLTGPRELRIITAGHPGDAYLAGLVLAAACLVMILLTARRPNLLLAAVCLAHSLVLYLFLTMQGGSINGRYAVAPALLTLTAIAALVQGTRWRPALLIVCALVVANVAANYRGGNPWRTIGPSWSTEITRAQTTCSSGHTHSAQVAIAPPGWTVTIPCTELTSDSLVR